MYFNYLAVVFGFIGNPVSGKQIFSMFCMFSDRTMILSLKIDCDFVHLSRLVEILSVYMIIYSMPT